MSQFYCREDELRKLNKRYSGDKFECIVIYGRRRVGKTALINEFCKDKPTIFFSALNTTGKIGFTAHNEAKLNDCAPGDHWTITVKSGTAAGEATFTPSTLDQTCLQLTPNWNQIGK